MKEFIKYYLMAIGLCSIVCCLAYFAGGGELLYRLATEQMMGIQLTILAINIPSYCILLSNVSNFSKERNIPRPPIREWLRKAFLEQIAYIVLGLVCSILLSGYLIGIIRSWILLCFTLTWFVMSIATMWDTFKSILVIDSTEE